MSVFRNLSIAQRLYLLNIVAAIGLIILSAITIWQKSVDLKEQKNGELQHLTENAMSLITGSVQSAAQGTQEVSSNIASVTEAASETGNAATGVLNATAELNSQAQVMREAVSDFLGKVKAA